jgi:hypothetical protein
MIKSHLYLTLLMIVGFPRNITSQEINPLDYFPHHVGDLWQYITYTQAGSEFTQVEVISVDTSFVDSSITITKFNGIQEFYFKIFLNDTLTIYQNTPAGWGILYALDAEVNSFWLSDPFAQFFTKYIGESESVVFIDTLLSREYWVGPDTIFILPFYTDHSALGIGSYYSEFEVGITVLNGCIINGIQYGTIINVEEQYNIDPPAEYLLNNFPSPFNPQTKIKFYVPERSFAKLKVYDILGNEIKILVDEEKDIGYHEILFDGSGLPSGIYFYTLQTPKFTQIKKMVLLK